MRSILTCALAFFSFQVLAQTSVIESDSSHRFTVMGRQVNFSFFSLASAETDKLNDEGGRIGIYNYLTTSTYVNGNLRLALRLPFQYNTAGTDRFNGSTVNKSEFIFQDVILGLQNYNLLYLPWDFEVYWEGRLYLPTSNNSQRTGLITRLRNNFIFSHYINTFLSAEYDQKFNYFMQSRTAAPISFNDEDGYLQNVSSATKRTEFENNFRLWGRISGEISVGWTLGVTDSTYNKSKENNKYKPPERLANTGPQIRFPITNQADFIFAYTDEVDRSRNLSELGQFQAKNTGFQLLSFIAF